MLGMCAFSSQFHLKKKPSLEEILATELMRLPYVALLVIAIILPCIEAFLASKGFEQTSVSQTAHAERPSPLLSSDKSIHPKRYLRSYHANKDEDSDEEERGSWEVLKIRLNLEKWFLRKEVPEYVRLKLQVPPSGGPMFAHKNYEYYMEYMRRYNEHYPIMKYA